MSYGIGAIGGIDVTPTGVHYRQKQYTCGCCCYSTTTRVIPLDKITDVTVTANWVGDCCGFAERSGEPWQLCVETASNTGDVSNGLKISCVLDPVAFRQQVLAAKRIMLHQGPQAAQAGPTVATSGANKTVNPMAFPSAPVVSPVPGTAGLPGQDMAAAVVLLERIDRAMQEALQIAKARQ